MGETSTALEQLQLVSAIADELPVGVWVARADDGAFVYANRAFGEIMGMGPEPDVQAGGYAEPYGIFGRNGELYPEEKMPFVRALRARAAVVVDDIVIHRRDRRRVYIRAFAQPMFSAEGAITHIVIAFTDMTDEVRAVRERADVVARAVVVEEQLANVLSQAPVVLFALDREGIITVSQGRGLDRMGIAAADLVGKNALELYRNEPGLLRNTRRALAGEAFTDTSRVGDGVFETTFTPRRDESGAFIGVIGLSVDVTERAEMQRRIVEVERLAAMGTVAATVAHEINNPLTYVVANLEVLTKRIGDVESTRALLADVREGVDRVRRIVRDLKAFSRHDERTEPTDLEPVIERAIALADNEIRHRARLVRELGRVPLVDGNEPRLAQLFINLLVNAAQSIPEGDTTHHQISVRLRHDVAAHAVVVEIADTGVGIPPELRDRVFEPFFTTKPAGSGTGLGLSICRGIVDQFGGRIELESEVGRGTTFRITLKVSRAATTHSSRPPPPTSVLRRGRLFVIDDDPRVANALRMMLEPDHHVEIETDAQRALERLLAGASFDVVFCDVMMPNLSGVELHRALTLHAPDVAERIAFVTGGAFTAAARASIASLDNPLLEKPFVREHIDAVLRARLT